MSNSIKKYDIPFLVVLYILVVSRVICLTNTLVPVSIKAIIFIEFTLFKFVVFKGNLIHWTKGLSSVKINLIGERRFKFVHVFLIKLSTLSMGYTSTKLYPQ